MRRAFTVIELLVAVVVLLAVIIATSKIFNTASKVSSTGEANADVLQQGTVIEEQLRRDLQRICRDGFMAIQCVEVPNDVNVAAGGPLLNPQLPATATLRCDQLVFFTAGSETSARWAGPGDLVGSGGGQQARVAMVRYGHGVQMPGLPNDPVNDPPQVNSPVRPIITGVVGAARAPIVPWTWTSVASNSRVGWRYGTTIEPTNPRVSPNQPEARQWVLARKATLLADDGGRAIYYPEPIDLALAGTQGASAAPSIFGDRSNTTSQAPNTSDALSYYQETRDRNWISWSLNVIPSPLLQSGWVDVAASDLDKVRRFVAPTLRLATPIELPPNVEVRSVSAPWTSYAGLAPSAAAPPLGWPVDTTSPDEDWPAATQVTVIGANMLPNGTVTSYSTQRDRIMRGVFGTPATQAVPTGIAPFVGLLGWPRSEKAATNNDRKSEMLVSPTLVTNCSSFRVDWTWEAGTGRQVDGAGAIIGKQVRELPNGSIVPVRVITGLGYDQSNINNLWVLRGYEPFATAPWAAVDRDPPSRSGGQPWFGLPDASNGVTLAQQSMPIVPHQELGGGAPFEFTNRHMGVVAQSIEGVGGAAFPGNPAAITTPLSGAPGVRAYTAVFGFNQEEAYVVTPDGTIVLRDDYTPWPTQIRITATIHDPRLVLDRGREFQFVIDVPKRRKD
jgi:competence protein ComGC